MNRIVIFASYDKSGIIHEYVISYLKKLKKISNTIIFVADNFVSNTELKKIRDLAFFSQCEPHGEYDFGSYKRGYLYAEQHGLLNTADELIFCNDSCFTVGDFTHLFAEMDKKSNDFWGITENHGIKPHLQSFFLLFKKNVFLSEFFKKWINSIEKKNNVEEVIMSYEIPLKSLLENEKFTSACFFSHSFSPAILPITLLNIGIPLVKKKIFLERKLSLHSVRLTLKKIKKISKNDYKNILKYLDVKYSHKIWLPFILANYKEQIIRFFYQKKLTKSGNTLIKICKFPVSYKNRHNNKKAD
jgi:O-antigen biosynthesis protein